MVSSDDTAPVTDDELLYRRIPVSRDWFDPELHAPPSPKAFRPLEKFDTTGLSMNRAKFYSHPREVAANDRGSKYWVASLRAGDIREKGMRVITRPDPRGPGHVEIPELRSDNRRTTDELQLTLAELTLRVDGPYS